MTKIYKTQIPCNMQRMNIEPSKLCKDVLLGAWCMQALCGPITSFGLLRRRT